MAFTALANALLRRSWLAGIGLVGGARGRCGASASSTCSRGAKLIGRSSSMNRRRTLPEMSMRKAHAGLVLGVLDVAASADGEEVHDDPDALIGRSFEDDCTHDVDLVAFGPLKERRAEPPPSRSRRRGGAQLPCP